MPHSDQHLKLTLVCAASLSCLAVITSALTHSMSLVVTSTLLFMCGLVFTLLRPHHNLISSPYPCLIQYHPCEKLKIQHTPPYQPPWNTHTYGVVLFPWIFFTDHFFLLLAEKHLGGCCPPPDLLFLSIYFFSYIFKGCTLFLYESDCRSGIDHNSVPKHAVWVENSIVQAVPEHPKKDFVFCLSNSVGDAFLFQVREISQEVL